MINMCDMSTRPDEIYNLSYSGSTSGSPTRWRNLQKKVSRRRLDQEPGPPQLVPLNVKEQQLKPEPSFSTEETHFGRLYLRSHPLKLATIGEAN